MNKRILLTIVALLMGTAAFGQPFELGFQAGTSVNGSSQVDIGLDIAYVFPVAPNLELGLGTGLRYARPMTQKIRTFTVTEDNPFSERVSREFLNEFSIPLFARIRYSATDRLFIQADAGYKFTIISFEFDDGIYFTPENLSSFYFEPQLGYRLDNKRSLSVGVSHQLCDIAHILKINDHVRGTESSTHMTIASARPVAFIKYTKAL